MSVGERGLRRRPAWALGGRWAGAAQGEEEAGARACARGAGRRVLVLPAALSLWLCVVSPFWASISSSVSWGYQTRWGPFFLWPFLFYE